MTLYIKDTPQFMITLNTIMTQPIDLVWLIVCEGHIDLNKLNLLCQMETFAKLSEAPAWYQLNKRRISMELTTTWWQGHYLFFPRVIAYSEQVMKGI